MKNVRAFLALALLAIPVFAQNAPRAQGETKVLEFEVTPPEINRSEFDIEVGLLVVREGVVGWTDQKKEGDIQLSKSEWFYGPSSEESSMALFYPLDNSKPSAFQFVDTNGVRIFALRLENGKIVSAKGARIWVNEIKNSEGKIVGLTLFLYVEDAASPNGRRNLEKRDFLIGK